MARSFSLLCLLWEAHEMDIATSRYQAQFLRNFPLFTRGDEYVEIFRLTEDLIQELEIELRPFIRKIKRKGSGLSNRVKILCALSFFANGTYQKIIGKNIKTLISQASTSRCINDVVTALCHPTVVRRYIRFPQNAGERQELKERFYEKFKIPGVIGSIDGTFVTMVRPSENEERYYCCKGNSARNVQVISDADLNILHVDPSYGGATHDSFIFNYGTIKSHLEDVINSGEVVYLLGDSGYAQHPCLMIPILDAENNTPEAYYNDLHATARNSVERTFAVLKGRFRCLLVHRVMHYHPDMVARIVIACCVLHNICNRAGLPAPELDQEEIDNERRFVTDIQRRQTIDLSFQTDLERGRLARAQLVNELWRSRSRM